MAKVYAVRKGYETGIFNSWSECEKQVKGFAGAQFKSFLCIDEAQTYLKGIDTKPKVVKVPPDALQIYVDGSYNPAKNIAGYGLALVKDDKIILRDFSAYPYKAVVDSRNVAIELIGARRAVELAMANGYKKLVIFYDYNGIEYFANDAWRAKTPATIEYQLFMRKYRKLLDITFVHVKAHSGNKFNEEVDRLAKFATKL